MTISFIRSAKGGGTASSATTLNIPFDATGCDAIVVGIRDTATSIVTGVTYAGQPLTLARHDGYGSGSVAAGGSVYVGVAPVAGANNVVISFSVSTNLGAVVAGFSGVNQASPVGNVAGKSGTAGSPYAQAIVVAAGSMAVDFHALRKNDTTSPPAPVPLQTLADGFLQSDSSFYVNMSYMADATSMGYTLTGPSAVPQSLSVIELKAAPVADTTPPDDVSAAVANASPTVVSITMTEAMDGAYVPAASAFTVAGHTVSSVALNGSTINLTVTPGFVNGEAARTVGYAPPGANALRDAAGNLVVAFSGLAITNNVQAVDSTAPTATAATVESGAPTSVDIAMSEPMNTAVTPAASAFAVGGHTVASAAWANSTLLRLTVGEAFVNGEAARTVAYTQPGTNAARDAAGNLLASFSGLAVQNNVAAAMGVSQYFRAIRGQSTVYADRVLDTTTSAGTGGVTLANASPLGSRTFAAAFPVGTARIPYCIEDAETGAWELGRGTLTGATVLTRDSVTASSNGNALVNFAAGTKNVFVTLAADDVKRLAVKSYIDLRDYPVDPTFTTDSTAGIQAAINDAFLSGVQTIRVPLGRYKIAGPVRTVDDFGRGCNGQIIIPASDFVSDMKSIRIIGEGAVNWSYGALSDVPVVNNGVIFESTLTVTSGSNPAVITSAVGYTFPWGVMSFTDFSLENVCIRTNTANGANKMGGLDLYNLANGGLLENVRVDVNRGLFTNPSPVAMASTGIRTSKRDNSGAFKWGHVFVGGYHNAVVFSEHMCIDRLTVYGCTNAVTLSDSHHASSIGMLNVENCKNSIVINGSHALSIASYDTEHNTKGKFFDFEYDIKYVSGSRKVVILQSTVVQGGTGVLDSAWATNATSANYKVVSGSGEN